MALGYGNHGVTNLLQQGFAKDVLCRPSFAKFNDTTTNRELAAEATISQNRKFTGISVNRAQPACPPHLNGGVGSGMPGGNVNFYY